ncbi:unnamed protein product [Callosobruchus maculatus]|uniref:Integrase catalytic domain-containing protein n=1 Tax=Callosobruchus maculatus TaxID=64391 RepID=A0A653DSZ9_CALMS|nr:unnamed protein product [Callosobruchus maculatus]
MSRRWRNLAFCENITTTLDIRRTEQCLEVLASTYWFQRRGDSSPNMSSRVRGVRLRKVHMGFAAKAFCIHSNGDRFHSTRRMSNMRGNSYVSMVADGLTKFVVAKPCKTMKPSEAIARLSEVFGEFGTPRRGVTDQSKAFKSKELQAFVTDKGIRHVMNAVATPRANGQVERANRTIVEALSSTAETEGAMDEALPDVVWGLNHTLNASTRFAPACLMFSHSRSRVADLAGELASDQLLVIGENGVPRNTANVPGYTAALGEAYVPGVEIVNRTDSSPKRMLARPVDDALSQVVGSEALGPAGAVISTQAGETDQPMAGENNHTMAGVGDADLVIAGGSNTAMAGSGEMISTATAGSGEAINAAKAGSSVIVDTAKMSRGEINTATAGGQKRVNLGNDSIDTNREVQGDDPAQESPTAGVTRKKRKTAGGRGRRWRPEVTRRSERLLQRTLTTDMAKTSGMTRKAVEGDFHKTSIGVTRGQADQVGKSTHMAGDPPMSGVAHDQAGQASGRTQLTMDGDVHIEHGEARGQARASGGTALSGDALGRGCHTAASNACGSVDSYARDSASTVLDPDVLRDALMSTESRVPLSTADTCGEMNRRRLYESSIGTQTDVCGETSSRLRHRGCIGTGCEFCLASSLSQRCQEFWPQLEACGESLHVSRGSSIGVGVCGGDLRTVRQSSIGSTRQHRRMAMASGDSKTKEQVCSTPAKAKGSDNIHERRIQALANISQAGRRMKMRYDKGRKVAVSYKTGDLVLWRNAATLQVGGGHSHKLANRFDRPYRVSKRLGNDRKHHRGDKRRWPNVKRRAYHPGLKPVLVLGRGAACPSGGARNGEYYLGGRRGMAASSSFKTLGELHDEPLEDEVLARLKMAAANFLAEGGQEWRVRTAH